MLKTFAEWENLTMGYLLCLLGMKCSLLSMLPNTPGHLHRLTENLKSIVKFFLIESIAETTDNV